MNNLRCLTLALACLALVPSLRAQPGDVRVGLVAYWPMDATDSVTTPDASHLGLNGLSLRGAPTFDPGKLGNAVTLNGASMCLTNLHSPNNAATGLPVYRAGAAYTVAMWIKAPAQTNKVFFGLGATNVGGVTAGQNPILLLQSGTAAATSGKFDVILRNNANATLMNHVYSTNVVFDNTWRHVAWVDDRGNCRLYIDGNPDPAVFRYTPSGVFSFNTTTIGGLVRSTVSSFFAGQIDDVALWERPLSQAEVQQVMNNSLSTPIPQLQPYIYAQPVGATRMVGDRYTFRAAAVGTRPVSVQWLKDGVEIPGAIGESLTLNNLTPADSGTYSFRVTDSIGSETSSGAVLTVRPDPAPDVRAGLLSYWPLDVENGIGDGLFTPDLYSGNPFQEFTNSFLGVPAVFGNGLAFNGVNQYALRRGGFPIYNNPGYSLAFWVKGTGLGQSDRRVFCETSTNSNNPLVAFGTHATGSNALLRLYFRNDTNTVILDAYSTTPVFDGNWHHVAWTETNGFGRLYIDGVLDGTDFLYTRSTLTLDQTALAAIFRNNSVASFFGGTMDDIAVWNRILTITEINQIRTNSVPPPISVIPPTITQQPASLSLLTRSRATFSFAAIGTSPLQIQWRKDGVDLTDETNTTLFLPSLALSDAGNYDVIVSNGGGSATSQVAVLTVTLRPPPPLSLKIDFNNNGADDSPANTEPGFESFSLPGAGVGPFTRTFGGADVTLAGTGVLLESRKRATPTNNGAFTQERLLQDFIFARDANPDLGMDVTLEFLESNTVYRVMVWSFDSGSPTPSRISDWTANGVLVMDNWSIIGTILPADDDDYVFTFDVPSDASGRILLQSRREPTTTGAINCFLNALSIEKKGIRILSLANFQNLDITLVFDAINIGAVHKIQSRPSLGSGAWTDVPDAVFTPLLGSQVQATFAAPFPATSTQFYRVVQEP
ncbi:MAG: hypothetical protein RJA22_744 [Verrucomicrobiota bacterium]